MANKIKAVEIRGKIISVRTRVDYSCNVTINLDETNLEQAKQLLGWINDQIHAVIEVIPAQNQKERRIEIEYEEAEY